MKKKGLNHLLGISRSQHVAIHHLNTRFHQFPGTWNLIFVEQFDMNSLEFQIYVTFWLFFLELNSITYSGTMASLY